MKVCQVCAVDFTLYHFLLPLMRGLRDAGHEVVGVCADGPLLAKVRAEGFRVEPAPISRSFNLLRHGAAYRHLARFFRREGFDMVHVHTPVAALVGRFAARRAGISRIVYTAHGFYFHDRMPATKRLPHMALEWLAGRFTDVLFTQAEEDAAFARRVGLIRGKVVEAIGNGVDPEHFAPGPGDAARRAALRAALDTPADAVVIAVIGRLVAEKGYPELFEAMRGTDAVLWVVGDRLESDHAGAVDTDKIVADPVLGGRVRFLGYRAEIPGILRAADIYTLPSHREGMPRSVIEAMMCALPVVGTDVRGTREEVVPDETGYLVPVADPAALGNALRRLAADPGLRARMGAAGRVRALAHYDEAKVVARQLDRLGLTTA